MKCHECQELLQRRLDGEVIAIPALDLHLQDCVACREFQRAAILLTQAVRHWPRPMPTTDLTERIAAAVLSERRPRLIRMRTIVSVAALAASLLLAVLAYWNWPNQPPPVANVRPEPQKDGPAIEVANGPSLQESASEVGVAMTTLTERLAGETREHAEILWQAAAPPIDLGVVTKLAPTDGMTEPLTPAAEPFREASRGVSQGIETVAQSAQRAVDFFLREFGAVEKSNN